MDLENNSPETAPKPLLPSLKQIQFHGKASEYFGIWLVNILLTILTLGLYSPWAKVRRINYMLGNIDLNGHRFKYLAKPLNILKGRIIAIILMGLLFAGLNLVQQSTIDLGLFLHVPAMVIAYLIFDILLAVLVWKGLQFSFRMVSYRNVQFSFHGSYKDTLLSFFIYPILAFLSLGLLGPFALRYFVNFIANNVKYGELEFRSNLSTNDCLTPFVTLFLAWSVCFIIPTASLVYMSLSVQNNPELIHAILFLAAYLSFLFGIFIVNAITSATTRNLIVNNAKLGEASYFNSTISIPKVVFITLTNTLAIFCSLGMATPWAQIRKQRYLSTNSFAALSTEVEHVISKESATPSAVGIEGAELMDVGVGL